jgi:predicted Zn-dependent peptidase
MAKVRHSQLDNGMDVYTQTDPTSHLMGPGVRVGSIYDPKFAISQLQMHGTVRISHQLEHIKARISQPSITRRRFQGFDVEQGLRARGCGPHAGINIHVTPDYTFYGTDLMLMRQFALDLLPIFADMVKNTQIDEKGMRIEESAIKVELLHTTEDNHPYRISKMLYNLIYKTNPIRKDIDVLSDLQNKRPSIEELVDFSSKYYVPNNMFAIMFGPTYRQGRLLAKKQFGKMEPGSVPELEYDANDVFPSIDGIKDMLEYIPGIKTTHVGMGFPVLPYSPAGWDKNPGYPDFVDHIALEVISQILEHRLHNSLRENLNIAYHPQVGIDRTKIHGLFQIYFNTFSERAAYEGISQIVNDIEDIKAGGVTPQELAKSIQEAPRKAVHGIQKPRQPYRMKGIDIPADVSLSTAKSIFKQYNERFKRDVNMAVGAQRVGYMEDFQTEVMDLSERVMEANATGDITAYFVNEYRRGLQHIGPARVIATARKYLTTPDKFALAMIAPTSPLSEGQVIKGFYHETSSQKSLF